jgi:hypothetical protein
MSMCHAEGQICQTCSELLLPLTSTPFHKWPDLCWCSDQSEPSIRPFGTSTILQEFHCQSNGQALSMLESHYSLGLPRVSNSDKYFYPIWHNKDVADELVVLLHSNLCHLAVVLLLYNVLSCCLVVHILKVWCHCWLLVQHALLKVFFLSISCNQYMSIHTVD